VCESPPPPGQPVNECAAALFTVLHPRTEPDRGLLNSVPLLLLLQVETYPNVAISRAGKVYKLREPRLKRPALK
jgi:hypothetical protein